MEKEDVFILQEKFMKGNLKMEFYQEEVALKEKKVYIAKEIEKMVFCMEREPVIILQVAITKEIFLMV